MSFLLSNLSLELFILFLIITRYGPILSDMLSVTLTGAPANEGKQTSNRIVGTPYPSARRIALHARAGGRHEGGGSKREARAVSLCFPETDDRSLTRTGATRKLEDIGRDLILLGEQGAVMEFFSSTQNADELSRLVEDIRDAIMGYQVRHVLGIHPPITHLTSALDVATTGPLR